MDRQCIGPAGRISSRALLMFFCLLMAATSASAQLKLSGTVIDEERTGVVGAVIMLATDPGQVLVETVVTDEQGRFLARSVAKGAYTLHIRYLGYKEVKRPVQVEEDTALPTIELEPEAVALDGVTVTARKVQPLARSVDGKIEVSVAQSFLADMGNALEVLRRSPGVTVDSKGAVSLSSLGGTAVYLNGRKVRMQGDELSAYLRTLPASKVERVEISANPDARYEAEGSGGIINIVLKEQAVAGLFVTTSHGVAYWKNMRTNSDFSLSYNREKWQLGVNYSHAIGHHDMRYGYEKVQDGSRSVSQTEDTDKRNSYAGGFDFVWSPSDRHRFSVNGSVNLLAGPGETATATYLYEGLEKPGNVLRARNDYLKQKNLRYGGYLNYRYAPSEKQSLSLTADWTHFDGLARNKQPNSYYTAEGAFLRTDSFYSEPARNIDIYALLADYRYAPNERHEWLAGVKGSVIRSHNTFRFERNGVPDADRSNEFDYDEKNAEGYVQYAYSGEKWSFGVGTRLSYMYSDGRLQASGSRGAEANRNRRLRFFPNLSLAYAWNERSKLSVVYSKRQDKPRYEDLNPFEYLLDELSYWQGNPFLKPQTGHKLAVHYTWDRLALNLSYNRLNDYFTSITDVYGTGKTVMTTKNVGRQQQVGLEAVYAARPLSWWDVSLHAGAYYFVNKLEYEKYRQTYRRPSCMLTMSNRVVLPRAVHLELSGRFHSKRQGGSYEVAKATGSIDAGVSRSWMDNRLRLSLLLTDILHSERWDNYGTKDNLHLSSWGYGESRKVMFRISYHFGTQRFTPAGKGAVEETDRL